MKFIKINILTVLALCTVIAFTACSKDDGAIPKRVGIEDVPAMTINLDPQKSANADTIRLSTSANYSAKFKVDMVFPTAVKPTKVDIVVRKNSSAANVKLFKADVTSYPTSFNVTAAEIATLFGAPLAAKDIYDFGVDIYVGSKKYEAFPLTGAGNGSGVIGMNSIGFFELVRIRVEN